MAGAAKNGDFEKIRIMFELLSSVDRDGKKSQRDLASELGIALGLVNCYLKQCITKGLVKVRPDHGRRHAYRLTSRGFAEKSRLTVEYVSYSLSLFRRAKKDCAALLATARARGYNRIAIIGVSELAEIAALCVINSGVTIIAVVDERSNQTNFFGFPLAKSFQDIEGPIDAVLVTDISGSGATIEAAVKNFGAERVLILGVLGGRIERKLQEAAS